MRFNEKGCKKMKNIFILIFSITCNCCSGGLIKTNHKYQGVDVEFEPYIKQYKTVILQKNKDKESLYDERINDLSVNFSDDLDNNTLGQCTWLLNGGYEIEINRYYWKNSTFIGKEFLIFHELEHCVRFRGHTDIKQKRESLWDYIEAIAQALGIIEKKGFFKDGCPKSIMYPYDTSELCNINHYNEYIQEIVDYNIQ
jgi:hypothetical protein